MKHILLYSCVAFFAFFVGSQVTEGALLVPYWKSMPAEDFYAYYHEFGPLIGRFYTVLTIVAALIPISISVYCKLNESRAFTTSLIPSFLAVLIIACFYVYFKGANGLFYEATLSDDALQQELVTWGRWHWGRVVVEIACLVSLLWTVVKMMKE